MHFPVEAKQMADFMRAHPQNLLGWPLTFVGVNHLKMATDAQTGQVDLNIPGGWALKFQCAAIVQMERMGKVKEYSNYKAANVRFNTIKNSYGVDNIRAMVRFKTWYQEDAPGVQRLHSRFEWWEAGILFLATGAGLTQANQKIMVPKMREVCDIREKSGGSAGKLYWSKRLGVSANDAMPAHDLGVLLERRPDVLTDIYAVLNITQQPYFKPGVDFLAQQAGNEHVRAQSDAADIAVAQLQLLFEQQEDLGVTYDPDVQPATEWPTAITDAEED